MASQESIISTRPPRQEPELETTPLAKLTRKTIERLAPFCQIRLPAETPRAPLVPKINSKILRLIQAVDTSMLVAQIGYRLASDAASVCNPFASSSNQKAPGIKNFAGLSAPGMLQTMAAHGHGHCLKASDAFRDVQQEIFKIAAATKDNESPVLVPSDPQQPDTRHIMLKEVGTNLVANLSLLERFSRSMTDLTSWWEWLEEELMSPNSALLPSVNTPDADLFARWSKIRGGYLDYYNTVRVVYSRYPQLFTTSSTAWQSISSVPPPPSSPGSSWDGSYEDLGAAVDETVAEDAHKPISTSTGDPLKVTEGGDKAETKEDGKNSKRFKGLSPKLRLPKLLRKKKKEKKDKEKKGEEVSVEAGVSKTVKQKSSQKLEKTSDSDKTLKNNTSRAATPEPNTQVGEKKDVTPGKEVTAEGPNILPATRQKSSSSSSSSEKKKKKKKGLAKSFAKLKKLFAKLGCQTGAGIEK